MFHAIPLQPRRNTVGEQVERGIAHLLAITYQSDGGRICLGVKRDEILKGSERPLQVTGNIIHTIRPVS